ncbi:hypothetical protein JTB14_008969 [Gonioctena quinquepunctata]|nr:hypothetical protein JTB14_008969 [Gonioctena quinquepunctata]
MPIPGTNGRSQKTIDGKKRKGHQLRSHQERALVEEERKKRKVVKKPVNKSKPSGEWGEYKNSLAECNKALRQSKRESRRRWKALEGARLPKNPKEPLQMIQTIRTVSGVYTQNGKDTLIELYRIQFPGAINTKISPETWRLSELKGLQGQMGDLKKKVIDVEKTKWAINSEATRNVPWWKKELAKERKVAGNRQQIQSLRTVSGVCTRNGKDILVELYRIQFPVAINTKISPETWRHSELKGLQAQMANLKKSDRRGKNEMGHQLGSHQERALVE